MDTREPVTGRRVRGLGLAMIGTAVILSGLYWVAWDRASHFRIDGNPGPWIPGAEIWIVAVLGTILVAAGIWFYRPRAGESLIAVGTIVTLGGAFHYWWTEMLLLPDGLGPHAPYPTINWSVTIPVTLAGLAILGTGISLFRKAH